MNGVLTDTIVVISTPGCHRCKTVARILDGMGVDYLYVDATEDDYWLNWMTENGLKEVPVTIKGETRIFGVDPDAIKALR